MGALLLAQRAEGTDADTSRTSRLGRKAVQRFEREATVPFVTCADTSCLREMERAGCKPGHLSEERVTLEGMPMFRDTFIRPSEVGCQVTVFLDHSLDYWGACKVSKRTCPSVEAALSDHWDTLGCTQRLLVQRKPCESPLGR